MIENWVANIESLRISILKAPNSAGHVYTPAALKGLKSKVTRTLTSVKITRINKNPYEDNEDDQSIQTLPVDGADSTISARCSTCKIEKYVTHTIWYWIDQQTRCTGNYQTDDNRIVF
ncbi:UNVERIFIED_CONTAM: hypothetical protein NCL1_08959 [Trichonephila clavipes]